MPVVAKELSSLMNNELLRKTDDEKQVFPLWTIISLDKYLLMGVPGISHIFSTLLVYAQ